MKIFFITILMILVMSNAHTYDEYNILIDNQLNKDEIEYFNETCKFNFNYTCIAIKEKMEEEKNGK